MCNRFLLFIILLFFHIIANAQIISTFAGPSGINDPNGLSFDSHGNLYIGSPLGSKIWKIDTTGTITIIAGTGTAGFSGDGGPATAAELNQVGGIAIDSVDNILFCDVLNSRIRKITVSTGIISTIVGNDTAGFYGDGSLASSSSLYYPSTISFDNIGNLYIADAGNIRVRKVNTSGIITTVAGNGILGYLGDGGPATAAECYPVGICTDNIGNLYISNYGVVGSSSKVRKVNTAGIISTFAGDTLTCTYNGDGIPATSAYLGATYITIHNGFLYLSDPCNNRIRYIDSTGIIYTVAGNGIAGYSGDGGPADSAEMHDNSGITFDICGNLYISDVNSNRIRKVTFDSTCDPYTTKVPQLPNNEIVIYPNPAQDELHIEGILNMEKYRLLNIKNNIEQAGNLQMGNNTINIQQLPPGMYFLEMIDEKGYKEVRKVVKVE